MNKIVFIFLVMFYSIPAFIPSCHSAINVAKGKPYTVSPVQNYPQTAPATNTNALTDGIYTVGYFWTKESTVGWQNTKTVEILIDLGNVFDVERVTFNTARRQDSGVNYPAIVAVFIGVDREHLSYVGDLADDPENKPGSYQIKKFLLDDLGIRGRYVLLEAIPKGVLLFCDEIEVFEGKSSRINTGSLSVGKARDIALQMVHLDSDKYILNKMADNLATLDSSQAGSARLQELRRQIRSLPSTDRAESVETELLAFRREVLSGVFPRELLHVQVVNPWAQLNPNTPVVSMKETSLSLMPPKGGYDSGAVMITNVSTRSLEVECSLDKTPGGFDLLLFQVPFIKTAALEEVADPLVPAQGIFRLRPGESRFLFLSIHGVQRGSWNRILSIKSGDKVASIPIAIRVAGVELPKNLSLNSITWGNL
ncbi:MAG: hypothetical protein PHN75_08085, partial [Syntrophales bacterium]|nr:hypothetical protein [Syntrophales bacterium]